VACFEENVSRGENSFEILSRSYCDRIYRNLTIDYFEHRCTASEGQGNTGTEKPDSEILKQFLTLTDRRILNLY